MWPQGVGGGGGGCGGGILVVVVPLSSLPSTLPPTPDAQSLPGHVRDTGEREGRVGHCLAGWLFSVNHASLSITWTSLASAVTVTCSFLLLFRFILF